MDVVVRKVNVVVGYNISKIKSEKFNSIIICGKKCFLTDGKHIHLFRHRFTTITANTDCVIHHSAVESGTTQVSATLQRSAVSSVSGDQQKAFIRRRKSQ